jgi:hypothetical protein
LVRKYLVVVIPCGIVAKSGGRVGVESLNCVILWQKVGVGPIPLEALITLAFCGILK